MLTVIIWGLLGLGVFQLAKIICKVLGVFFKWLKEKVKARLEKMGYASTVREKEVLSFLGETLTDIIKTPDFTSRLKDSPRYNMSDMDKMAELLSDTVVIADYSTKDGSIDNIEIGKAEQSIDKVTQKMHEDNGGFMVYA